jgi:hypothetical protein
MILATMVFKGVLHSKICGPHSRVAEDSSVLGRDAVSLDEWLLKKYILLEDCLIREDEGQPVLRNVGKNAPSDTASYTIRPESPYFSSHTHTHNIYSARRIQN